MSKQTFIVPGQRSGMELDEFLSVQFPRVPKGQLRRLIREGQVSIDGVVEANPRPLRRDAYIEVKLPEDGLKPIATAAVDIPTLYEDDQVLCVDKPAGLAVEPERWNRGGACLIGALVARETDYRPRIVHRIDKGTSGVLVLAKNLETERHLRRLFEDQEIHKEYLALVEGEVPGPGEVDLPLGPDKRKAGRMKIHHGRDGKPARTLYRVAEAFRGYTLVTAEPKTGRTHQIRIHLAARGFPLAVDDFYGSRESFLLSSIKSGYRLAPGKEEKPLMSRLSLHASRIRFSLPGGQQVQVLAPLPKDFELVIKKLQKFRRKS